MIICNARCWEDNINLQFGDYMLKTAKSIAELDYAQLLNVYVEHLFSSGSYGSESVFYDDLSDFLAAPEHICCLWAPEGRYKACVRVEPHRDGVLLTCLETAPECRRQGYGLSLVAATLQFLIQKDCRSAYVHVAKKNSPSIALHRKIGFYTISDSARLVDGTVSQNYITMKIDL